MPTDLKTNFDIAAIGTAVLSFFKVIPWAEMAAFVSFVYLLIRVYFIIKNKGK